ncbi:hypothetical protein acdb102_15000 [Acidothermaceae bacterium B102]|nr:hypothetical protein acdb102_15000 [Acidothermaceae bacterium B102]
MYVWIWRTLPGNWAAKLAGSLLLLAGAVALLLLLVFPFVEPRLPWNNVNVDQPSTTSSHDSTNDQPTVTHSGLAGPGATSIRITL